MATSSTAASMRQSINTNLSKTTGTSQIDRGNNLECITFAWLDLRRESNSVFVGALRAINDYVKAFTDFETLLRYLNVSDEKVFAILPSVHDEVLASVHQSPNVQALFILDSNANAIRGDLPKLIGVYSQQEELIRALRMTFETFEQVQLEAFTFETENVFLWWQLWHEEVSTHRSPTTSKANLIELGRNYYRGNTKRLKVLEEFEKSYRSNDSLRWCFQHPFPSRLLKCALMSPTVERVASYQFLVADVSRVLQQQSKRSSHGQLYRGMKLSKEAVDLFETHTGKLVCPCGFFMCSKARNNELQFAMSPGYRTDLISVLFKIDFDGSARFADVVLENESTVCIFDVGTNFRIICVNRGSMTVIKMKTVLDEGKKIAQDYKGQHKGKTVLVLLDELTKPPKPPTPPPPPPPKVEVKKNPASVPDLEAQAKAHLDHGDIDKAISTYRSIQPISARILKILGQLSSDEKHDYPAAIEYYCQALKLQEETGDNIGDTLLLLGSACLQNEDIDAALKYYNRALSLYEASQPRDANAMALCFTGMSNAYRGRKELLKALDCAQRAWTLTESSKSANDKVVAKSLHLLTNIYHELGDEAQALKLGTRAMGLMERIHPSNPLQSAELLNTLGLIQMKLGDLTESRHYFERAVKIYHHSFPSEVEQRTEVENNLQTVLKMLEKIEHLQYHS